MSPHEDIFVVICRHLVHVDLVYRTWNRAERTHLVYQTAVNIYVILSAYIHGYVHFVLYESRQLKSLHGRTFHRNRPPVLPSVYTP